MSPIKPPRYANILQMLAPPPRLVQLYVITIDGQQLVCVGPALHPPKTPSNTYNINDIEIGDTVPVHDAIRLLDGSFTATEDVQ